MSSKRYATIDIGTVTSRLLVADVDESGIHELQRECVITNLGEGVDASGVLKESAMQRVDARMAVFQDIIDRYRDETHPTIEVIALATSASRDAKNAADFIELLSRRGIVLTVIPGQREAALSFLGASSAFIDQNLLVVDVGGGSTELIVGIGGQEPLFKHSFDIGCRRVTEKFLTNDPPTSQELKAARAWIRPQMEGFFETVLASGFEIDRVVAVAGTATTAVSIDRRMENYDSSRVHRAVISRDTLHGILLRLAAEPLETRRRTIGLDPGRAPVIVAGMMILEEVLDLAHRDSFTASESDILQGIVLDDFRRQED